MKHFVAMLLLLVVSLPQSSPASMSAPARSAVDVPPKAGGSLEQVQAERMAFYNRQFPDIRFVVLEGGAHWLDSLSTLYTLLGKDAKNLDYECPEELQADLLAVCIARVKMMLQASESSATLFRAGVNALSDRPVLCVVTLDAEAAAGDDFRATAHLVPLPEAQIRRIPRDHWLAHREYLAFVIDHEVFHCLDSYYNRPIPRSQKELWAQYMGYYNENGADAFAMALHLQRHGRLTDYARDLLRIRGIALYSGDVNHYTYDVLKRVLLEPVAGLASMSVKDVLRHASVLRAAVVPDYNGYVAWRERALRAAKVLAQGTEAAEPGALVEVSRACFNELFGRPAAPGQPFCVPR